jgi:hypothetical protein
MEILTEKISIPLECNLIFGMSHFIKTVEDLYEIAINSFPNIKFGLAFNEASGPCLVRKDGNDNELIQIAVENIKRIGAGHTFLILLRNAYPINILRDVKLCREVATVYCATANPVEVILAQTEQGRGVLGVIDGFSPKGIELDTDITARKKLLRVIGYKR